MESTPILVSVADAAQMLSIGRTRRAPIAAIQDYVERLMDEDAA